MTDDVRTKRLPGTVAIDFLKELRPKGPWVLTAIFENGGGRSKTGTQTFTDLEAAREWIVENNDPKKEGNVCYSINPTKQLLTNKASREGISTVEYLHVDADPKDNETSDAFKARMLPVIDKFDPQPTFVIDSGNGLHILWRLREPYKVITVEAAIAEIETRSHALALALGANSKSS